MEFSYHLEGIANALVPARFLTPDEGDYTFGYYDLRSYSDDGKRHLASRLPFTDHLNAAGDRLELGYLEDRSFHKLAETEAWCFQQGSMLQYEYDNEDIIFYNTWDEASKTYHTVKKNLKTGKEWVSERACANISRDGKYGVAINFNRVWDFRPGYGYPNRRDPYYDIAAPEEDGVFLCNFETGECRLLVSYADFVKQFPIEGRENAKFVVNHITFNPSGNRFLMLVRNFRSESVKMWSTSLVTVDLEGNMRMLAKDTYVSHYWWMNDRDIIAHMTPNGETEKAVFIIEDTPAAHYEMVSTPDMLQNRYSGDIHTIVSPKGTYLIGDSYPRDGYRHIWVENLETRRSAILLSSKTVKPPVDDIRCDLHVRFDRTGDRISFDAFQRGKRDIVEIDFSGFHM